MADYETPEVQDYGSLQAITEMLSVTGLTEDSANKAVPFHHTPPADPGMS